MPAFSDAERAELHRLWLACASGHCWTGWAHCASRPDEVWLFRERTNWRRFRLARVTDGYLLMNEAGMELDRPATLAEVGPALVRAPALDDVAPAGTGAREGAGPHD